MKLPKTNKPGTKVKSQQSIIYPGSFDPVTKGHVDVIERLSRLFNPVYVVVADSPRKSYRFERMKRVELMQKSLSHIEHVQVLASADLTVNIARELNTRIIARSVRTVGDWEYEYAMAFANKKLAPEIETFFIMADPELGFISSSLVREVALFGGDVMEFVPPHVARELKSVMKKNKN